jgi:hypothetical protein
MLLQLVRLHPLLLVPLDSSRSNAVATCPFARRVVGALGLLVSNQAWVRSAIANGADGQSVK